MDFLQPHNLLPFFLFLFLSSSSLPSNADHYFLNCGSSSNTPTNDGRTFTGDSENPGVILFAAGSSVSQNTASQSELYKTAMVFSSPAAYRFNIAENGTYILRLHFHASSSSSSSRFNVSASGHMLLPDFRPNLGSVVIEEFLLLLNSGEFNLYFIPDSSSSAVAFVNAIELFLTPLTTFSGAPVLVSSGIDTNLVSRVLHPIYRINFGGQTVPLSNDRLWRTWLPDEPYLQSKSTAKNGPIHISRPNYQGGNATDFDAPDAVYNTAKELNIVNSGHLDKFFNATWSFNVSRRSHYFVRVHFCDMISAALGATVFNLYISNRFAWKIDPFGVAPYLAAPFYLDFLVESDDSGLMNVSVGPRNDTRITENAFINGLEIIEILSDSAVEPEMCAHGLSKKRVVAVVGLVACIIALTYLLTTYLKPKNEVIKVKSIEALSRWPLANLDSTLNQKSTSDGYVKVPNYKVIE